MRMLAACSLGGASHLRPLLGLLAAADRRGDEVLVVGPPALAESVQMAGHTFRAGGDPGEDQVAQIRERLPLIPAHEASVLGNRELFGRLATTAMLPGMERICADWLPGLVLREPCEYASAVVAHRLGIPTAQVAISLAEAEDGSITTAGPALEAHRKGMVEELRTEPYLTRFPASLDPSPFPFTFRFRDPGTPSGTPLPEWWPGSHGPLIYVSLGTVLGHMSIATGVYRTLLEAVEGLQARILLTLGHGLDAAGLGVVPANVHVETWVEQADVLQRADLVVCHGGSGTVFGALAAGVPVVVVPLFADQFENARRIADAGAGRLVELRQPRADVHDPVIREQDAVSIFQGIDAALGEPSYRREARRISAEMAATPTADDVLAGLVSGESLGPL